MHMLRHTLGPRATSGWKTILIFLALAILAYAIFLTPAQAPSIPNFNASALVMGEITPFGWLFAALLIIITFFTVISLLRKGTHR